jgi:hypothetical protein
VIVKIDSGVLTANLIEINEATLSPVKAFKHLTIYGEYITGCFEISDGLTYASAFFIFNDVT